MTALPALKTKSEALREKLESGSPRDILLALLSAMSVSGNNLPEYGDIRKIYTDSTYDFRRNDFSNAADYVDSLIKIAEHYQDLAENYRGELAAHGARFYETGEVEHFYPFTLTEGGNQIAGTAEAFSVESESELEGAIEYLESYHTPQTEKEARHVAALVTRLKEKQRETK